MLSVTYDGKTYNVDVKEMDKTPASKPKGGTRRNKKRSKPTRRIKR